MIPVKYASARLSANCLYSIIISRSLAIQTEICSMSPKGIHIPTRTDDKNTHTRSCTPHNLDWEVLETGNPWCDRCRSDRTCAGRSVQQHALGRLDAQVGEAVLVRHRQYHGLDQLPTTGAVLKPRGSDPLQQEIGDNGGGNCARRPRGNGV